MNNVELSLPAASDAELVAESLRGNREAFAAIVGRYQSLVCSLTYSATGDLARSEDLAQETFIAAWKSLRGLKEPAKLKSWLCGIARNLVHNTIRREQRQPAANAEDVSAIIDAASPEPLPSERAISQEEQALMWRALADIPETYREPLVMFYREQQSITRVAAALDLSEDAVKQRLSRGRKLLSDQVAAFVEGTLRQSGPGRAFTYGVIAALPMLSLSAGAATVGAAAVKGSTTANGVALGAFAGAIFGPVAGMLGSWIGYKSSLNNAQSELERQEIRRGAKITIAYVLSFLAILFALVFPDFWHGHAALWATLQVVLWVGYIAGLFALIFIMNRRLARIRQAQGAPKAETRCSRYSYQSKLRFLGLPLIDVQSGVDEQGRAGCAFGWIAIGDRAYGAFAFGGIAVGLFSMGGAALGLFSCGGAAVGLLAFGGLGSGYYVLAGVGLGYIGLGGSIIAWQMAVGGVAIAHEMALGGIAQAQHANDAVARGVFESSSFMQNGMWIARAKWLPWLVWIPMSLVFWQGWRMRRRPRSN
jgi:RNA polymerase sigma factor (sigma-70 family)